MTNRRTFMGAAAAAATVAAVATHAAPAPSRNVTGAVKLKDGAELFVRDWGVGRPVILTHAWPLSSDAHGLLVTERERVSKDLLAFMQS
jgi:hypothetical protein